VVFDFSKVREIDSHGIGMLLHCAEKVIKRNGDLKFAAVGPEIEAMLELTQVDSLFETFDIVSDAVESYLRWSVTSLSPSQFSSETTTSDFEIAA